MAELARFSPAPATSALERGALLHRGLLGIPEEDLEHPVAGDPDQAVA